MKELNNEDDIELAFSIITSQYENFIKKQFQLAYLGHISISDSDNMDIHEFKVMYSTLLDQLEMEKEIINGNKK